MILKRLTQKITIDDTDKSVASFLILRSGITCWLLMSSLIQSLLEKIEDLLHQGVGDIARLEHIKKSVIENKELYNSDIQYVEKLEKKIQDSLVERSNKQHAESSDNSCWKCGNEFMQAARFCSFCGIEQKQASSEFEQISSRRLKQEHNPLKLVSNFYSYQVLAVFGGLVALIPILIAILNMERIFELVEFYTGNDLSEFFVGFMALGVVSSILCTLVIIAPVWIKKPKKVGKVLFFSSFGILFFSILVGIVGFPIILFAGIMALKKRRY